MVLLLRLLVLMLVLVPASRSPSSVSVEVVREGVGVRYSPVVGGDQADGGGGG